jgi:hypothetical protein
VADTGRAFGEEGYWVGRGWEVGEEPHVAGVLLILSVDLRFVLG